MGKGRSRRFSRPATDGMELIGFAAGLPEEIGHPLEKKRQKVVLPAFEMDSLPKKGKNRPGNGS